MMEPLALFFSASGRIAPKPFALAVAALYLVSFAARGLLATPVLMRGGMFPFALVQAVVVWSWFSLHAKRRRDAGRGIGAAIAVAVLFAIAVMLVMFVGLFTGMPGEGAALGDAPPAAGQAEIIIVIYLLALFTGDPHLGMFGYFLMGIFLLILAPIVTALLFSLWTGTRPSLPVPS
jgi:uncharacterized membrane protein YhaH (DUF805 family)